MLKKLIVQNFVHFKNKQTYDFDGSCFFIGGNGSGKSCTFEAVRRCMSTSKNFFMSTNHDKSAPSYVICEYTSNYETDAQRKTIYSCVVAVPPENTVHVKLVIEKSKENKIYVDLVKKNRHGYPVNESFPIEDPNYAEPVETFLNNGISIESLEAFVCNVITNTEYYRSFVSERNERDTVRETKCETYLKETINKMVVITEPMRSVSVAQWSNSPKFERLARRPDGDDRFTHDMLFNSDIISWYLNNNDISPQERIAVDDTFDYLTENGRIRFQENEGGVLEVIDNGNVVTLEKAPEGILEAKICAILLSVEQFKTLCLEEPGKGMHTQMIERLKDLALKERKNKTIIMITHVPAFLNTCDIRKIFFFRRSADEDGRPLFRAIHGSKVLQRHDGPSLKISADYSLTTIFFASRVLLVEGRSDERFISAMKSILFDDREMAKRVLNSTGLVPDRHMDALYQFLSSLQVLPLNGHQNKVKFESICSALALERYFILDYDAILDKKNSDGASRFFRLFDLGYLESEFRKVGVTVLEGKGIFVWKKQPPVFQCENQKRGTIEDALIQLINTVGEELKDIFTENHAVLNWDYTEKNDKKLFEDKDLTDDNVAKVVLAVIQSCLTHSDSDVFRLLKFLVLRSCDATSNMTSTIVYERF